MKKANIEGMAIELVELFMKSLESVKYCCEGAYSLRVPPQKKIIAERVGLDCFAD
jgi:hypothetical protein